MVKEVLGAPASESEMLWISGCRNVFNRHDGWVTRMGRWSSPAMNRQESFQSVSKYRIDMRA